MVNFKAWAEVAPGTRVRVNQPENKAGMNGQTGTVLKHTGNDPRRTMVRVKMDSGTILVSYVSHMERIEDMTYVKNLVGPKPEPVQEPTHPTPWSHDGRNVVDANGKVVIRIREGGYLSAAGRLEQPMAVAFELARVIAKAVTKFHSEPVEDSKSPF